MTQQNRSRRDFMKLAATAAVPVFTGYRSSSLNPDSRSFKGEICLFSKHLPTMDWAGLARSVKELGFDGVDLTVRPGGHVLPESAADDLPRAVQIIRETGLSIPMITTGLTSADDPNCIPILSTAGSLSIPYFKPGYYRYAFRDVRAELHSAMRDFTSLANAAKRHRIAVGFHNHENYIGAPLWDVSTEINKLDPQWAGYYFDVRHAVCEGGAGGWKIAFNLIAPRMKMIAIKDFYWGKTARGWRPVNCPLGEGMVDWKAYFTLLKSIEYDGPVSLHLEYEIAGSSPAQKEENTLIAIRKDLEFLKRGLEEAYNN